MIGYRSLDVYQRAYNMAKRLHQRTLRFPKMEMHELGSQIRRSAVSVVLNIAEGYGRKDSKQEFQHFLRNAIGSSNETRVLIELCKDLGYIEDSQYQEIETEYEVISKQLYRLRENVKS